MSAVTSQSLSAALAVLSLNIEGLTAAKASIQELCKRECCHCLCLQETHRSTNLPRPEIAEMSLVVEPPHKYGRTILIRNDLKVKKIYERVQGTVEIITIVMSGGVVHSVCKPPNDPGIWFQRQQPTSGGTVRSSDLQIVVNTSLQTVYWTVFRTRVSLQRLS